MQADPKARQRAAGAALAVRRGDIEVSVSSGAAKALGGPTTPGELKKPAMTGESRASAPARKP